MLDMQTSDGRFAFQFEELEDLAENREDYGITEEIDLDELGRMGESALVVMTPSGKGGWRHRKVIGADQLQQALHAAGLLPQ